MTHNNSNNICCELLGVQCRCIDLSHPLDEGTIMWPGGEKFNLCMSCSVVRTAVDPCQAHTFAQDTRNDGLDDKNTDASGIKEQEYFYAAGTFSCSEHGGTHVDAPYHFSSVGQTVDLIPLTSLMGCFRVIDISLKCMTGASGGDYVLSPADIVDHERDFGPIGPSTILLIRTGWSQFYSEGVKAYLGYNEEVDGAYDPLTSKLCFPGIGAAAARLLVDRGISAVGIDTASIDAGRERTFIAHRILLGAGIYGIENINSNIDELPVKGGTLLVMPMKITGGSGAPARVSALIPLLSDKPH